MIGVFFLPFEDASGNFSPGVELDAMEYVKMVITDDVKYKGQVVHMMNTKFGNNMSENDYQKWKKTYKSQKMGFLPCRCNVLNINGKPYTEEEMNATSKKNEKTIIIVQLDKNEYSADDLLSRELEGWIRDTKKIQNIPDRRFANKGSVDPRFVQAQKLKHSPSKDFRVKTHDGSLVILRNAKFLEHKGNITSFAILVNQIIYLSNDELNKMIDNTKKKETHIELISSTSMPFKI